MLMRQQIQKLQVNLKAGRRDDKKTSRKAYTQKTMTIFVSGSSSKSEI